MTEEEELKQQIIEELKDIAPGTMKDVLALIRTQKAEEDEEEIREARIARERRSEKRRNNTLVRT